MRIDWLVKHCWVGGLLLSTALLAESKLVGLVGGGEIESPPCASLLFSDRTGQQLTIAGSVGAIQSVALNATETGFLGGWIQGSPSKIPYAALLSSGDLTPVSISISKGYVNSVAINQSGAGLIGGGGQGLAFDNQKLDLPIFAAYVLPGSTTANNFNLSIDGSQGTIAHVALTENGSGLIGGTFDKGGTATPYAAFVDTSGGCTPVPSGLPTDTAVVCVATNDQKLGLIGGYGFSSNLPFAAFVSENSVSNITFSGTALKHIVTTALNNQGDGLIGGGDFNSSNALFLARLTTNNTHASSLITNKSGMITSVALNEKGKGLIGGMEIDRDTHIISPYVAVLPANGTEPRECTTTLPIHTTQYTLGYIFSVALNDADIGLIGGGSLDTTTYTTVPYVAIVAPDNTVTPIPQTSLPTQGLILSVATIPGNWLLNQVMPQSAGSYSSATYSQLAAQSTLSAHLTQATWSHPSQKISELSLVAGPPEVPTPRPAPCKLWLNPFGAYVDIKSSGSVPSYTNSIGGLLVGFDYHYPNLLFGGAFGYAFNYAKYSQSIGHGNINEELACFYTLYEMGPVWISGALWGGIYQVRNIRHTLGFITSTSTTHGGLLSPHFEAAVRTNAENYRAEPFAALDWTNTWTNSCTEKGSSGMNITTKKLWTCLLQTELGLRLYCTLSGNWGKCLLQQKLSYVNQKPFHYNPMLVSFVASTSTFPVATGSNKMQNLGSAALSCSLLPNKRRYPNCTLYLATQLGSSFHAYTANVELNKTF